MSIFARPEWLWLLMGLPLVALQVALARWRRRRDWVRLGQGGRLRGDGSWGWLGGMTCLILALAQPRWGHVVGHEPTPGQDMVLLVDTSRSMGAEDAIPNRLGVAVEAADSLLAALGRSAGTRAAVVAFAGRGVVRCPLTENLGAVADALRRLRPGGVQPGGTDLGAALEAALKAFEEPAHAEGRSIVLFSDGEDHAGTWTETARHLREAGVVVHSVAIGDPAEGHPVPSGRDGSPLTYRGEPVASKRTDAAFEALAVATGGAVVRLGLASADLGSLYASRIAPVARRRQELLRPGERAERYPLFVVLGLALGLAGSWPGRRRWWRRSTVLLGLGLSAAVVAGGAGGSGDAESPAEAVSVGRRLYASGDLAGALATFNRAVTLDPRAAVPRYNAAATLFRLGRYAEAGDRYRQARELAGPELRTKIDYALGNATLALGDVLGAIDHYESCLASRVPGAALDAVRGDAAVNKQFAERRRPPPPRDPREDPNSNSSASRPSPKSGPPSAGSAPRPSDSPQGDGQGSNPSGLRGPGGAGGQGPAPPRPGSPEARLATALENVRDARRRRLPEEPPPPASGDRKDW